MASYEVEICLKKKTTRAQIFPYFRYKIWKLKLKMNVPILNVSVKKL